MKNMFIIIGVILPMTLAAGEKSELNKEEDQKTVSTLIKLATDLKDKVDQVKNSPGVAQSMKKFVDKYHTEQTARDEKISSLDTRVNSVFEQWGQFNTTIKDFCKKFDEKADLLETRLVAVETLTKDLLKQHIDLYAKYDSLHTLMLTMHDEQKNLLSYVVPHVCNEACCCADIELKLLNFTEKDTEKCSNEKS